MISIGIDVSKNYLDCASTESDTKQFLNNHQGVQQLIDWIHLLNQPIERVILEATGRYHILCTSLLAEADLPVVVATPKQVRDFAKAMGILAKTDALDAKVIAL